MVKTDNYVQFEAGKLTYRVVPVTEEIIRMIVSGKEIKEAQDSLIIEKKEYPEVDFSAEENAGSIIVKTVKVCAEINTASGDIIWKHADGSKWLSQKKPELTETDVIHYNTGDEEPIINRVKTVDGERNFIQNLKAEKVRTAYRGKLFFTWKEDEEIHGLGQAEEGIYNYRGHCQYLYQHNMRIPMPVLVSTEGYGILVDCCSLMTFNDDLKDSYLFLDTVDQIDYYFMGGHTMDEIIHDYRYLTGKAQMLPKWAYGYVQSKEQYYTAKELLEIVRHYRKIGVPLDCVVQDWNTWDPGNWGEKILDQKRYGDMKECTEEIHKLNAHTMVSVWPNMNAGGKNHTEFFKTGHLLYDYATYDAFNEEAREMYWKQAQEGLFDQGFDSWWCDSTEPFSGPDWSGAAKREPWERYELVGGEHKKYLDPAVANAFALMHAKGIYENQRKTTEEKRVLNLTRSGYASGQKYSAMLWSGDTCASWDNLKTQIVEGLNMGLSGYPYWTLDIGAFFTVADKWQNRGCGCNTDPEPKWFWQGKYNEGVKDKGYCELYTRWLEMGTFLPMFRSHGTDTPREIWNFGEKGTMFYDAIEKFIKLRYHLMPYIYSLAGAVHFNDYTIMRSLLFDFPEDKEARKVENEFMFGPSLLICAVTEPMYYGPESTELHREKTWKCYLPSGTKWYDYWTNKEYEGGQYVTVDAPIDRMPIFVKAGSILPVAEGLVYASQKPEESVKLMVYPGEDCKFTIYEDEGNNYNFENGAYATTELTWDDKTGTLTVGGRQGSYPGMEEVSYVTEVVK
ncbi:TIM-barrel domain-containing protein [Blautia massiliensis (ex Durand et al. 2017)]|uniref:glycoside hydrolase family 31 protein n=1 Tax=Blautia massiliensis (ex Durand et al. 2017) TaxID=1737424 RepID=UPI0022E9728D|nr:TIM-barrel domain-containing protein [Blautia massiliensis (ex Durand et al. 2017)]